MRERRVFFERLLRIDHRRERLVVDVDEVECVPRDRPRLGDNDRNRVADEVDTRTGQDRVVGRLPARNAGRRRESSPLFRSHPRQ